MGGAAFGLIRPVGDGRRISSFNAHWNRTTPSSESGVDYYCPIGTPVLAAGDGVVVDVGGGTGPATGRYVTIDLDNGFRVRYLHLSRQDVRVGWRVTAGQQIGLSGASGYGSEFFGARNLASIPSNTGGPHVHTTLWPYHRYTFGRGKASGTVDFELYAINSAFSQEEGFLMALAPAQQGQVYDSLIEHSPAGDYYKTDAILGDVRTYGAGLVARTDAANTRLDAVLAALAVLDPSKTADIKAFEAKLRESEARTAATIRETVGNLRSEILAGLAGVDGVDPELVTAAVDKALDRVFVR